MNEQKSRLSTGKKQELLLLFAQAYWTLASLWSLERINFYKVWLMINYFLVGFYFYLISFINFCINYWQMQNIKNKEKLIKKKSLLICVFK